MDLRRGVAAWLFVTVVAALAMLLIGCGSILGMAEGLLLKDGVVAETAISPQSDYIAEAKASTTVVAVAAAQEIIEHRWGLRLKAEDLSALSSAVSAIQDALEARALDEEAAALRHLEDTLRALEPTAAQ